MERVDYNNTRSNQLTRPVVLHEADPPHGTQPVAATVPEAGVKAVANVASEGAPLSVCAGPTYNLPVVLMAKT